MKASIREKLDRSRRVLERRDPRPEAIEEQLRRDLGRDGGPRTQFLIALIDARAMWRDYRALVEAPDLPGPREIAAAMVKGLPRYS